MMENDSGNGPESLTRSDRSHTSQRIARRGKEDKDSDGRDKNEARAYNRNCSIIIGDLLHALVRRLKNIVAGLGRMCSRML